MKKVGLVPKPSLCLPEEQAATSGGDQLLALIRDLTDWLAGHGARAFMTPELMDLATRCGLSGFTELTSETYAEMDLIIVLGGDGTMLHAASLGGLAAPPLLGVNLGSLGFLTEVTINEVFPTLNRILEGKLQPEERMRLAVKVLRGGKTVFEGLILNDVVLTKGALARIVNLTVSLDDKHLTDYRADGLIVSTPTGSTAYNLSAGGPIVTPTLEGMILTPICPFTLANRPILVPASALLTICPEPGTEDLYLTCDGQQGAPLEGHDQISISRTDGLGIYPSPFQDHYSILRTKLGWGQQTTAKDHVCHACGAALDED